MLLKSIVFLAMAAVVTADYIDRTPMIAVGCEKGLVLAADSKLCCPKRKVSFCSCDEDEDKLDQGLCHPPEPERCPEKYFGCPAEYGGNCCPENSFCAFNAPKYLCLQIDPHNK